jgi:hypothetical protein
MSASYIYRHMERPALLPPAPARYEEALRNLPPSGGGGCHTSLLSVANLVRLADKTPEAIFADLRAHAHGKRRVTDREIHAAVAKAFAERGPGQQPRVAYKPAPVVPRLDAGKMLRGILAAGDGATEADLFEQSPVRLDWPPQADAAQVLRLLYRPDDPLFIGDFYDSEAANVRPAADWLRAFERGVPVPPHIIPNPLTGQAGETKDGKVSWRADSCVAVFRFALAEFDATPAPLRAPGEPAGDWPREAQFEFWAGALAHHWPVAALIDSGGKSIHAWLAVDVADAAAWTAEIEDKLFRDILTPLGADSSCRNEARLSRTPGHFRRESDRWQRILYANPHAGDPTP